MFEGFFGPKLKSVDDAFLELQAGDETLLAELVAKAQEIQHHEERGLPDHQRVYVEGLYEDFDQLLRVAKISLKPARATHSEAEPTEEAARTQLITKLTTELESTDDAV